VLTGFLPLSILNKFPAKTINNGIDTLLAKQIFEGRNPIKENRKKVIICVANVWDARKGLNEIIELAKILPIEKYEIKLVGEIRKKNVVLPKNIRILGKLESTKKLYEEYSMADVFANPTMEDNYPTVNIESICCGTPVVAYDVGGVKETIKCPSYGTTTKQDAQAMAQAIQKYPLPKDFTPNWEIYDQKNMCEQYLVLYQS
jgi:putative colanic acid biosynthesis glycosyltransferase